MPGSGSVFAGWSGDGACGFSKTCSIPVGNHSLSARFETGGYVPWAVKADTTNYGNDTKLAVTPEGDAFIAGQYAGSGTVNSEPLPSSASASAFFVAKLAPIDGAVRWVRGYPNAEYANVQAITMDPDSGDVVVAGTFTGTLDLGGTPLVAQAPNLFIGRLRGSDGGHVWSTAITDIDEDVTIHLAVDQGRVIAIGSFHSIDVGDGILRNAKGNKDMYFAWYSLETGDLASTPAPRTYGDTGAISIVVQTISVDHSHNVVVGGNFEGSVHFDPNIFDPVVPRGLGDAFVAKYTSDGSYLWAITGGGSASNAFDRVLAVTIGPANTIYAVGKVDLDVADDAVVFKGASDAATLSANGNGGVGEEVIALSIASDGQGLWARRFGGGGLDAATGVSTDTAGNLVMVGYFETSVAFDSFPVSSTGSQDAFVVQLDSSAQGAVISADRYGGPNDDKAWGIVFDPMTEHWLLAGTFDAVIRLGDKDLTTAGYRAGFCARIIPTTAP